MLVKLSNSKIENRAVDVLRNVIDNHYTMDHQFNAMDKEMSWDGYIWIYNHRKLNMMIRFLSK